MIIYPEATAAMCKDYLWLALPGAMLGFFLGVLVGAGICKKSSGGK